jgi:hypothetical protein
MSSWSVVYFVGQPCSGCTPTTFTSDRYELPPPTHTPTSITAMAKQSPVSEAAMGDLRARFSYGSQNAVINSKGLCSLKDVLAERLRSLNYTSGT